MTGAQLPEYLGGWVLVIGTDPGLLGLAMSVPDSEGSHLLPEDLGSGEPVSGLWP